MTKPKLTYSCIPQRSDGAGFHPCEPHAAQRFAVVEEKRWLQGKRRCGSTRVVFHSTSREEAEEQCGRLMRLTKPARRVGLGQRFISTGRKVLAHSLSQEQYLALQQKKDS